ncbi:hypothetical protein O181_124508 [Austropuccinia psidii MF-1]|uniref:Uncharacterized protein n=1 Tax=Austropuccinia psidii MF-1 TaxID=1389203 RepID=A0A9Q3Q462_9BASI|nr:hypothetical protein [Austropuccinia psidii MF-1]
MLDDLLHHLLTEMAMDGEEGCLVARIDGCIESFYSLRRSYYPSEPAQLIDSSYKNFKNIIQKTWPRKCHDLDHRGLLSIAQSSALRYLFLELIEAASCGKENQA